jgi:hypothetical protein
MTPRADASLQVGEAKKSITVEPNAVQVQSETNEVSQTISPAFLSELQTDGRNVIQLAALVAGAASSLPGFGSELCEAESSRTE